MTSDVNRSVRGGVLSPEGRAVVVVADERAILQPDTNTRISAMTKAEMTSAMTESE
jgi:hypothetical protein